jgi:O-antigen ligase
MLGWLLLAAVGAAAALAGPSMALRAAALVPIGAAAGYVLSDPAKSLVLYAFLVPLDIYVSVEWRVTAVQLLQVGIVVGWGLTMLLQTSRMPPRGTLGSGFVRWALALALFLVVSTAWSIDLETSVRSVLRTCAAIALAALVVGYVREARQLRLMIVAACIGGFLCTLYGLAQFVRGSHDSLYPLFSPFYSDLFTARGGRMAIVATFSNPNIMAGYGALLLPLAWSGVAESHGIRRLGWTVFGTALLAAVIFTFSKAGSILVVVLTIVWLHGRLGTTSKLLVAASGGILTAFLLFLLIPLIDALGAIFPDTREASIDTRLGLWPIALRTLLDRPVLGFGLDSFGEATASLRTGVLADLPRAHNLYLQLLVDLGIVGSVLFWGTLISGLRAGLAGLRARVPARGDAMHLGLTVSALGIFLYALVDTQTFSNQYVNAMWLIFALLAASSRIRLRRVQATA